MGRFRVSLDRTVAAALILTITILAQGCSTPPKQTVSKDSVLVRYVDAGREAFDEGDLDEAEKKYRRALMRAWAIDDPYESGTVAYNLAACLTSRQQYDQAADWLIDARIELCRAQSSAGNTWLLSAEIAMAENRFEDAERYVGNASSACPPCDLDDSSCLCGPSGKCSDEECRECCIEKLPGIGPKLREKQADRDCQQGYEARIELARARIAAKQFDAQSAERHLALACELSSEVCDLSLQADRHDVAALIHDVKGEFLQAGAHRDREVKLLRCIGQYREIPNVLDAAAQSYLSAERIELAVDRMVRSARIRLARGQLQDAWLIIRCASDMTTVECCDVLAIRLGLTAKIIQESLVPKTGNDSNRKPPDSNDKIQAPPISLAEPMILKSPMPLSEPTRLSEPMRLPEPVSVTSE